MGTLICNEWQMFLCVCVTVHNIIDINKHAYIIISNAFTSRISSSSSREKLSSKLLPPTIEPEAVEIDVEVAVDLAFVTC